MVNRTCIICKQTYPVEESAPENFVCTGCWQSLPDLGKTAQIRNEKPVTYRVEVPQYEGGINLEHEIARLERATSLPHRSGWLTFSAYTDVSVTVAAPIMVPDMSGYPEADIAMEPDRHFEGKFGHVLLVDKVDPKITDVGASGKDVTTHARNTSGLVMVDLQLIPEGKLGRALIGLRKAVEEGVLDQGLDKRLEAFTGMSVKPRTLVENYMRRYCDMPVEWEERQPMPARDFMSWVEDGDSEEESPW